MWARLAQPAHAGARSVGANELGTHHTAGWHWGRPPFRLPRPGLGPGARGEGAEARSEAGPKAQSARIWRRFAACGHPAWISASGASSLMSSLAIAAAISAAGWAACPGGATKEAIVALPGWPGCTTSVLRRRVAGRRGAKSRREMISRSSVGNRRGSFVVWAPVKPRRRAAHGPTWHRPEAVQASGGDINGFASQCWPRLDPGWTQIGLTRQRWTKQDVSQTPTQS